MAAAKIAAPQQYSQPSRKGKKAWRKNIDVSEIHEGLEQAREQAIRGTILAEAPSSKLFITDTLGSETIQKQVRKVHKPLKVDEILAQRSAIPAVSTHKRAAGTTDGVVEPKSKKYRGEYVSPQERERLRRRAYAKSHLQGELDHSAPSVDPWAESNQKPSTSSPFIPEVKPIRAPKTIMEAPISLLASGQPLPSVLKPKAAHSYNPNFQDWDETLKLEGEKEVLAEKERQRAAAEEAEREARIAAARAEPERDPLLDDASEWEGFESEFEEDAEWLSKKRPERKTPAQRNKANRRKEAERLEKHQAKQKARDAQLKKIKDVITQVSLPGNDDIQTLEETANDAEVEIDDDQLRKKRYGRIRIPTKDLELVLPDELQDSLRALKPEGNLLKDRFRNMMVSGRIEARPLKRQPAKKAKTTVTEKWTYKDFTISA